MYVGKRDINKALRILRKVIKNDQTRDDNKRTAKAWIDVYKQKLKEYDN